MFSVSQMCGLDVCGSGEGDSRCFLCHRCVDWILVRVQREAIYVFCITDVWIGCL